MAAPARLRTASRRDRATALVPNHLHHDPAGVVEEPVLDRLPAPQPERLRVDGEQALRLLERVLAAVVDRFQYGALAGLAEQHRGLRGPQELHERLRLAMLPAAPPHV